MRWWWWFGAMWVGGVAVRGDGARGLVGVGRGTDGTRERDASDGWMGGKGVRETADGETSGWETGVRVAGERVGGWWCVVCFVDFFFFGSDAVRGVSRGKRASVSGDETRRRCRF